MSALAGEPAVLQAAIDFNSGEMQERTVQQMSGTSMATPVTAGNALLIRQFFLDSAFWSSVCPASDAFCMAFSPSSALVKACLLTSGTPVARYSIPGYDYFTKIPSQLLGSPPGAYCCSAFLNYAFLHCYNHFAHIW